MLEVEVNLWKFYDQRVLKVNVWPLVRHNELDLEDLANIGEEPCNHPRQLQLQRKVSRPNLALANQEKRLHLRRLRPLQGSVPEGAQGNSLPCCLSTQGPQRLEVLLGTKYKKYSIEYRSASFCPLSVICIFNMKDLKRGCNLLSWHVGRKKQQKAV